MTWKVKPGRLGDFIAQQREFRAQMTAAPGSPSYEVWTTTAGAGEEPHTTVAVVLQFESGKAYGEYMDAIMSDEKGFEEMMTTAFGPDAPAVEIGVSTAAELPLG